MILLKADPVHKAVRGTLPLERSQVADAKFLHRAGALVNRYQIILDHMDGETPAALPVMGKYSFADETKSDQVRYNSGSEFSEAIVGVPVDDVLSVVDELMDTVEVLIPKLYRATIDKLKNM